MEALNELTPDQLEALVERLAYHAWCKMKKLSWRGAYLHKGGAVPGGFQPQDFAADAFAKILDGTRQWNKTTYPLIEDALKAIIDSDINHLAEKSDNRKSRRDTNDNNDRVIEYEPCASEPEPLRLLTDAEWKEKFHADVMQELGTEEHLKTLFECFENDITRPEDIALMMNITPDDVTNLKKKLRRKLDKLDPKHASPMRRKTK